VFFLYFCYFATFFLGFNGRGVHTPTLPVRGFCGDVFSHRGQGGLALRFFFRAGPPRVALFFRFACHTIGLFRCFVELPVTYHSFTRRSLCTGVPPAAFSCPPFRSPCLTLRFPDIQTQPQGISGDLMPSLWYAGAAWPCSVFFFACFHRAPILKGRPSPPEKVRSLRPPPYQI